MLLGRSGLFGFFRFGHGAVGGLRYGCFLRLNRTVAADVAGLLSRDLSVASDQGKHHGNRQGCE